MQKKSRSRSAFVNLRAFLALFLIGTACSVVTGTFLRPEAPAKISQRTLTFAERVAYQRAIEEVYWRHRIWPKERPDPKPSLDAVMSQAQLETKVADYLRNSQALEDYWQRPITAEQLQAEMERMAKHTKQPEVLRELFAALGNDPFVIAECLARPVLGERLLTNWYGHDRLKLATVARPKEPLESWLARAENQMATAMAAPTTSYRLPNIPDGTVCIDNSWTAAAAPPDARSDHTAVWTGSEMIIWGGYSGIVLNTGGRYNPSTDSWTATNTTNAPLKTQVPRFYLTAQNRTLGFFATMIQSTSLIPWGWTRSLL
jgi:hypothetical protein